MTIDIDQCHRIGKRKDNRRRTIIFKLNKFKGISAKIIALAQSNLN